MRDAERETSLVFGPHRLRLDPPDIIRVWWNGKVEPEHVETVYTQGDRWFSDGSRYFVLADMSRHNDVSPAARKKMANDPRARRVAGLAALGASFRVQVVMGMFVRAVHFLQGGETFRLKFCAHEAEAFAWIEAERAWAPVTRGG